jgi:hypothetical protein
VRRRRRRRRSSSSSREEQEEEVEIRKLLHSAAAKGCEIVTFGSG